MLTLENKEYRAELFDILRELYQQHPRRRTIFAFLLEVPHEHRSWLWDKAEEMVS